MSHLFVSGGQTIGASASPYDEYDLLAVHGTLESLLKHHSSKTSLPLCSAFFMVQLSESYMTTGKIIALLYRPLLARW